MSAENITVLLLHGAATESAGWNPGIRRLRAERVDVFAPAGPDQVTVEIVDAVRTVG